VAVASEYVRRRTAGVAAGTTTGGPFGGTLNGMSTDSGRQSGIRASDAERHEIARMIQEATAEGRLTVEEADDRIAKAFAATYRDDLPALVADLPRAEAAKPPGTTRQRRVPFPLAVHAAIVVVWSALLVARWAASDADFFWPAFPIFWLTLSVLVHAGIRQRQPQRS
jgi:hypothetical protein